MSIPALNWALSLRGGSQICRHVLLVLANYSDDDGICWPSPGQIMDATSMSRRSVFRGLRELSDAGALMKVKREGGWAFRLAVGAPVTLNSASQTPPATVESASQAPGECLTGTPECLTGTPYKDEPPRTTIEPPESPLNSPQGDEVAQSTELILRVDEPKPPERAPPKPDFEAEFAEWYARYPLHKARKAALLAFRRARKEVGFDDLMEATAAYAVAVEGKNPRYVKHPATWLNQGCWTDEPEPYHDERSDQRKHSDATAVALYEAIEQARGACGPPQRGERPGDAEIIPADFRHRAGRG